jgi:hypothetical protein
MAPLSLVKDKNTSTDPFVRPHTLALRDNLKAVRDTRAELMLIVDKDRKAAADIALCDAISEQMQSIQQEIDSLRADCIYAGQPPPDVRTQEKKLATLQQLLKRQQDAARAATLIKAKYSADMARLNEIISTHRAKEDRLTWVASYDVVGALAAEYLEWEAGYLERRKRLFSACALCDALAREHGYGEFLGAGLGADFRIPRPSHPAYDDHLTPEQSYREREKYSLAIAEGASLLVRELRGTEQN